MATTSAIQSINIGYNICQSNHYKNVQKIAGLTITVTSPVGEIVKVNIFLRPGRSHVGNWQKLASNPKIKFYSWEMQLITH